MSEKQDSNSKNQEETKVLKDSLDKMYEGLSPEETKEAMYSDLIDLFLQNEERENKIERLEAENSSLSSANKRLVGEKRELTQKNVGIEEQNKEFAKANKRLVLENKSLKSKNINVEQKLGEKAAENKKLKSQVSAYRKLTNKYKKELQPALYVRPRTQKKVTGVSNTFIDKARISVKKVSEFLKTKVADTKLKMSEKYHNNFTRTRAVISSANDITLRPGFRMVNKQVKGVKQKITLLNDQTNIQLNKTDLNKVKKSTYTTMALSIISQKVADKLGITKTKDATVEAFKKVSNNYKQHVEANQNKHQEVVNKLDNNKEATKEKVKQKSL